ncbi:MAG: DUF4412 domain-containing protein [Nitrospirae bacterium]|jgi:hypothetical protein|nr:DUF4412 domain-containing protein [Nitrospirota bacterium]
MKAWRFTFLISAVLSLSGTLFAAEPFSYSADQTTTIRSGGETSVTRSRVFVSGENLREEIAGGAGVPMTVMIVRMDQSRAWSLDASRKIALSIPFRMTPSQRMLAGSGKRLPPPSGTDRIDGVLCDRIDLVENGRPAGTEWRNHKTGFPVRYRSANGQVTTELSNFRPGAQPANLFVVPPDYRVFDMKGIGGLLGHALGKMAPSLP